MSLSSVETCCGYPVLRSLGLKTSLVCDEQGRRLVAKKLNDSCLLQGRLHPGVRERLERLRELPVLAVANFHGVLQDRGIAYLIWSFIEGRTLADQLSSMMSLEERGTLLRDVLLAVENLHHAGLVHGAIHARNVIVDDRNVPHLTHVSPLMYGDAAADLEALKSLAEKAGVDLAVAKLQSSNAAVAVSSGRRTSFAAAAVAVIAGLSAIGMIWRLR